MNYFCTMIIGLLVSGAASPDARADLARQPPELAPRETSDGVIFQCWAPDARSMYIAGSFNNWANNNGGVITNDQFRMEGPDEHGVFRITVALLPGVHAYKFCRNGEPDGWFVPSYARLKDGDANAVVIVDGVPDGDHRAAVAQPPRIEQGTVTFELFAPEAHIVFLAGDFNGWAEHHQGYVHDHRFAMKGPDQDGIWRSTVRIPPGSYRYKYVINGQKWIPDPLAEPASGNASLLEVK